MSKIITEYVPSHPEIAFDYTGEGPVVIFLHGIGGNRTNWRQQLIEFSKYFTAVAWDARGYGLSSDYEGGVKFDDFVNDLNRLMIHLKARKAHLVGLSMGGFIAMGYYEKYPEQVDHLVLCNTLPSFTGSFSTEEQKQFLDARLKPLRNGMEPADIAPKLAHGLLSPKTGYEIQQKLTESLTKLHKESYMKTLEAATFHDKSALLPKILVPTLLVFGEDDRLTPPEIGEEMANQIPQAELKIIPDAGHLVNMEQADAFNETVIEFLSG